MGSAPKPLSCDPQAASYETALESDSNKQQIKSLHKLTGQPLDNPGRHGGPGLIGETGGRRLLLEEDEALSEVTAVTSSSALAEAQLLLDCLLVPSTLSALSSEVSSFRPEASSACEGDSHPPSLATLPEGFRVELSWGVLLSAEGSGASLLVEVLLTLWSACSAWWGQKSN